jgi:hypothetical protein
MKEHFCSAEQSVITYQGECNWCGESEGSMNLYQAKTEPNTITFHNSNVDWVMRITADRRIEVNEGVEVTEAAQKVLDAMQQLLTNGLDKAVAAEREACAKICDSFCQSWLEGAEECADAIRARGKQA